MGIPEQKLSDAGNKDLLFLGIEIDCEMAFIKRHLFSSQDLPSKALWGLTEEAVGFSGL